MLPVPIPLRPELEVCLAVNFIATKFISLGSNWTRQRYWVIKNKKNKIKYRGIIIFCFQKCVLRYFYLYHVVWLLIKAIRESMVIFLSPFPLFPVVYSLVGFLHQHLWYGMVWYAGVRGFRWLYNAMLSFKFLCLTLCIVWKTSLFLFLFFLNCHTHKTCTFAMVWLSAALGSIDTHCESPTISPNC